MFSIFEENRNQSCYNKIQNCIVDSELDLILEKNIMKNICLIFYIGISGFLNAQQTENIILITSDGLRWQDIFQGMDSAIANNPKFNENDSNYIFQTFWDDDELKRRKKLLPFFWSTIRDKGQIYGNRKYANHVNVVNPYKISFPGYHEILTGYADTLIKSNSHPANPNVTILEFLNQQSQFNGRVAAFAAWDAFDRIINEERSKIPVVNGFEPTGGNNPSSNEKLLNEMLKNSYRPWGEEECLDMFTHYSAIEHLKTKKPKVLYISYGETDEWAHYQRYRSYLDAARQVDKWIQQIWEFVQSDPQYKNKTSILFTTDHGRGIETKERWTDHGKSIDGSSEIWFAIMGPDITASGEVKLKMEIYQDQFAQTIAKLLGFTYKADHPISPEIKSVLSK